MEDYKEKLKEALNSDNTDYEVVRWIVQNFPQLKMCEDERIIHWIRKELEDKYVTDNIVNNEMADKALAWLEKQGKHQKFCDSIQVGDKVTRNKDGVLVNLSQLNRVAKKQGEQKAKIIDFKAKDWYVSKVDGKIYNAKFMEEPLTNQKRRLEIEKAAMSATGIIEQEEWFIKGAEWSDKNPFCIRSEKQDEQKPAENKGMNIVEEDMTPFQKKVFCIIDTTIEEEYGLKQVCDELLRLAHDESMQKITWKPSDEQMKFLWKYAEQNNYDGRVLTSLYQDLKKLKGRSYESE